MKIFVTLMVLVFIFTIKLGAEEMGDFGKELWQDSTFVQEVVDASKLEKGIIKAKVDGEWKEFELVEFPQEFMEWNTDARIEVLEGIQKGQMPDKLEGPHNGIVATYGYQRGDSQIKLNNAIKGMGFLPKRENIKEINQKLQDTHESDAGEKLGILLGFYENADSIFDLTKQVSLELYANPERGTQTFLNQMTNPSSVIVFMAIPTFKLKTIAYLLHPDNPKLTEYEKDVVEYVNLIHSYFHGDFDQKFIAVMYNVIEVYNSSPGTEKGKGTRITP